MTDKMVKPETVIHERTGHDIQDSKVSSVLHETASN
jgi:hypothetical protein